MKQPIRSFALGLLSAGILLLVMFYFTNDPKSKTENMSTDDMIKNVEAKGYHVLTESEYISVSVTSDENKKSTDDSSKTKEDQKGSGSDESQETETGENTKNEKNNSTSEKDNRTVTYTLTVESGMAPSTISGILADNDIIKDQDKFTQYMEEEGYTTKVQLGDFELTSKMSHYEIAEKLTN
ncbi:hypothetical protein [Virgibacillus sp. JSM 102003]|uniref:hypothetical protein n=1 Tax=Virgibacillus sp. JSM 102003 TaxID=1562108 RepID=UPI0035C232DC